jgi:hypothetical protein
MNQDGETDSSSTSQILQMIKLDIQESTRLQEDDIEYHQIQVEGCHIQLEEDWKEQHIQQLRAVDSTAQFEQSSQIFLQLLGNLINQQHKGCPGFKTSSYLRFFLLDLRFLPAVK